jgi:hypothetical protein
MYGVFKYALSPNIHSRGAKVLSSNLWNSDIPLKPTRDNMMSIPGTGLICPESAPEDHRLLDNSVQTSSSPAEKFTGDTASMHAIS